MPRNASGAESDVTWGRSTVRTACPLDCPDSCTLDVTVENGRVVKIDGGDANPSTRGYICGKVRRFTDRLYGEDRLLYPAVRKGAKGQGVVRARHMGRSARPHRAADDRDPRHDRRRSDPAVLLRRIERAADAGHERRRAVSRLRDVAPRAHGLRRADRRREPGALRQDARRHLRRLRPRPADRAVGRQPVGVRHPPGAVSQGGAEGRRARSSSSIRAPRRWRGRRTCTLRRGRAPICRSRSRCTASCSKGASPTRRSSPSTRAAPTSFGRARASGRSSGRRDVAGIDAGRRSTRFAEMYRACVSGADPMRLGPRAQPERRQRGGGHPRAAGGRRKVRRARRRLLDEQLRGARHQGGGVDERHAGAADAPRQHESPRPRAARVHRSADPDAVRLQLQSAGDDAGPEPRARGPASARICSRSSTSRSSPTRRATRMCVLPATTFLENYDIAKGYGPISLQLVRPVIEPCGEARAERGGVLGSRRPPRARRARGGNRYAAARRQPAAAAGSRPSCMETGVGDAAVRRRADAVRGRVPADAGSQDRSVSGRARQRGPARLYGYQPDPGTERVSRWRSSRRRARRRCRRRSASCASAPPCCRCTRRTPPHAGSRPTIRSACSTISARSTCPSR